MYYTADEIQKSCSNIQEQHGEWLKLAKDHNTPLAILETLANYGSESILSNVIHNPSITSEILFDLAGSNITGDWQIRSDIAMNAKTPVECLKQYAKDEAWQVRSSVAGNPNLPTEILFSFANDPDHNVRFSALKNMIETDRMEYDVVENFMTYGERQTDSELSQASSH